MDITRRKSLMSNFFKMTMPVMVLSYVIFYFIYKKLGAKKLINCKTSTRFIVFWSALVVDLVCISITDSFEVTKEYHSLFTGLFLGVSTAVAPFIVSVNKNKTKE
jgi:hypothetical protein